MRKIAGGIALLGLTAGLIRPQTKRDAGVPFPVIVGKPYSATETMELHRVGRNGMPITAVEHGRVYRDSAGRIRIESVIDSEGAWLLLRIGDPVAGFIYKHHRFEQRCRA